MAVEEPGPETEESGLDSQESSGKTLTWFNCRSTWRLKSLGQRRKSQGWIAKYPQVKTSPGLTAG
jgi:hypothetical protein